MSNSELLEFLKSYDIARQIFPNNITCNNENKIILMKYYDSKYEHASVLVTDDEFVGITFKNLDILEKVLKINKLSKRK